MKERTLLDELDKIDPPTPLAHQQEMELFRMVLAMREDIKPEWSQFLELVREMIRAESVARTGIAYGQIKAERARRPLIDIIREWDEQAGMKPLNFKLD